MTKISVMSSLVLVLAVLAGLCLSTAKSQTINPCDDSASVDAVQPFIYNISDLHETICPNPPIPGYQDVLLCAPAPGSIPYLVTAPEQGVPRPEVCLMMNSTFCVGIMEESVGILIQLNKFSMSEELEISVHLNVYFGNGSRPLQIVSGKNLSLPGSLVIAERVFGMFEFTKVCEILDDGTVIDSEFSTMLGRSDCLKAAVGSQNIDSGVAQSITLLSQPSSQPRTVTLFLISNTDSCSSTVNKLSNNFTVNIKINQTPTPGPTDPLPTQGGTELGVIIGGVVGFLLLLLAIVVVVIIFCLVCRLRSPPRIDYESHTDGPTKYTVPTDLRVSAGNYNTGHFTERDSGVGCSPFAPRTPADDCTVIVAWDYNDPWYSTLKEKLGKNFDSSVKELVLTEDLKEFKSNFNKELFLPEVRHLLLIENVDEANHHSFYSSCLEKFIGSIESGACDELSKVWYIRLGSPEEFDAHTAINRLGITQSKASMTGEECAHAIHKKIYSYDSLHSSSGPHDEKTSSFPEKVLEYLEDIKSNSAVCVHNTQTLQSTVGVVAENIQKVKSNTEETNETTKRTLTLVENSAEQQERETLVIPDDAEKPNTES